MTLRFFDGFDVDVGGGLTSDSIWTGNGGSGSSTRFSRGGSIALGSANEYTANHGNNDVEVIIGIPVLYTSGVYGIKFPLVYFYDGATRQCTVTHEADNSIGLRRGDSTGTLVASFASAFTDGVFDGFAVRVKFSATVGQFEAWKNGSSLGTAATGLNNISTANAYSNKMSLACPASGGSTVFDDFYYIVVDGTTPNAFPGDVTVYTLYPNGAGSSTQWTPDSGSNFARVQEQNSNEDGSYVADSTVGHIDEYTLDDLPGGFAGTILGVETYLRFRKDDAGVRQVSMRIKSGSTVAHGTTVTCTGAYFTQRDLFVQNPDIAGAWTSTTVNALKLGPEVIT